MRLEVLDRWVVTVARSPAVYKALFTGRWGDERGYVGRFWTVLVVEVRFGKRGRR